MSQTVLNKFADILPIVNTITYYASSTTLSVQWWRSTMIYCCSSWRWTSLCAVSAWFYSSIWHYRPWLSAVTSWTPVLFSAMSHFSGFDRTFLTGIFRVVFRSSSSFAIHLLTRFSSVSAHFHHLHGWPCWSGCRLSGELSFICWWLAGLRALSTQRSTICGTQTKRQYYWNRTLDVI